MARIIRNGVLITIPDDELPPAEPVAPPVPTAEERLDALEAAIKEGLQL